MSIPNLQALLAYIKRIEVKELFALPSLALRVVGKSASLVNDSPVSSKNWLFVGENLRILTQVEKSESVVEERKKSFVMAPGVSPFSKALADILQAQESQSHDSIQISCQRHFRDDSSSSDSSINIVFATSLFTSLEPFGSLGQSAFFKLRIGKFNRDDALRFTIPLTKYYATIKVSKTCLNTKHSRNYTDLLRKFFKLEFS